MNRKQRRAHKGAASSPEASKASVLFAAAVENHRQGRLGDAEALYGRVLALEPRHADALHRLGLIAYQVGAATVAIDYIDRALGVDDRNSAFHTHRGLALAAAGRLDDASSACRTAVSLNPQSVEGHANLALILMRAGQFEAAEDAARRTVALAPSLADGHAILGDALQALGRTREAIASYRRAIDLAPDDADAHASLAGALRAIGDLDGATASLRKADALTPDHPGVLNNLALTLQAQGDVQGAMETVLHGLAVAETPALRQTFVHCVKTLQLDAGADVLRPVLTRALSEGWGRPEDLVRTALDVVRRGAVLETAVGRAAASPDPAGAEVADDGVMAELAKDELLLLVLTVTPNIDFGVERVLASARSGLLKIAEGAAALSADTAAFCAALAHQCFINEYVFGLAPGEAMRVAKLRQSLSHALASREGVPAAWVLAAACYAPLSSIPFADRLCEMVWPEAMAGLLKAQIAEPETEAILRRDIPRLTPIRAPSLAVQAQYEENPYPRWIRTTVGGTPETLSEHLLNAFPQAGLAPFKGAGPEVLIAGCGAGRNALETHRALAGARTLAIDLSLTSLGYAWRKAREAGETDLQFAQADLLDIAALGRSFDLIEASGVLHHLADPFAGWRALLSVLRPGGVMRLGFYSALARRDLPDIEVAEPTPDALRQARQTLAMRRDPAANQALLAQDFYSLSGCRDLLFHTREHRFALGELAAFMREAGLSFIGFVIDDQVLAAYRRRFPLDPGGRDLDAWAAFEQDHPDTFAKMYQFWVQKI